MIHYNTSNDSAAKMQLLFEEMGIENNCMHLELLNPLLLDVDPFSENLTMVQKGMIIREIMDNPWYFFREVVRIPSGGSLVRFEFHRGNIALIWASIYNISAFAVWPRQAYKTVSVNTIYARMVYWGCEHGRMAFLAHEDAIVKKNLQGVKDIRDNLPSWLNIVNKDDRDNEKEIYNSSIDNRIICRAPARNADDARKAGRGLSTAMQWYDEVAFIKNITHMYDSISFAYSKASEAAKANGAPYHQIFTTSAGFLNTDEGKWGHRVLKSCADFTEKFYDMDIEDVRETIANTSPSNILNISFMYYDLGKDEYYLAEQRRRVVNSDNPEDTIDREVLNKWKDISTDHPLGQERVIRLGTLSRKPYDILVINNLYTMRLYVDLDTFDLSRPLVIGMDLGGNLKGDFSVLVIVDPTTFEVVGVLRSNSQSSTLFSDAVATIMTNLFPKSILFPERNYNAAVIDSIVEIVGKHRVYHETDDKPGLFNSKNVRPILLNNILKDSVDNYGDRMYDETLIDEICGLIRTRSGRIDHKPGNHDDVLMGYLLAMYFMLYVKDVGKYFDSGLILSKYSKYNLYEEVEDIFDKSIKARKVKLRNLEKQMTDTANQLFNSRNGIGLEEISRRFTESFIKSPTASSVERLYGDFDYNDLYEEDSVSAVSNRIKNYKQDSVYIEDVSEKKKADIEMVNSRNKFMKTFGWG